MSDRLLELGTHEMACGIQRVEVHVNDCDRLLCRVDLSTLDRLFSRLNQVPLDGLGPHGEMVGSDVLVLN